MQRLKENLKRTFLYAVINRYRILKKNRAVVQSWMAGGKPGRPPQAYKYEVIKNYARASGIRILVETGTFHGDSIFACLNTFDQLFTIELDPLLFENAARRFKGNMKVKVLQGDSGTVLGKLLTGLPKRCVFWLDGHYSEGETAKAALNTPIIEELQHIFAHPCKNHIILIDDARCFTGADDYPAIEELTTIIRDLRPDLQLSVADDIIRIEQRA